MVITTPIYKQGKLLHRVVITGLFLQLLLNYYPPLFIPTSFIYKFNYLLIAVFCIAWSYLCIWWYYFQPYTKSLFLSAHEHKSIGHWRILIVWLINLYLIVGAVKGTESLINQHIGRHVKYRVLAYKVKESHSRYGPTYIINSPVFYHANQYGIDISENEYNKLSDQFVLELTGKESSLGFTLIAYRVE